METSALRTAGRYGRAILLLWCINAVCCKHATEKAFSEVKVPYYNSPDFTPIWTADKNVIDTLHTVGAFSFTDQFGDVVTNKTFAGKIYIADFFFSKCPSVCPKITANMQALYEHYKNNPAVCFLSYSVTPETDSVPILKKYAEEKGVTTHQWHFVTGSKNDIYNIARKGYFAEQQQGFTKDSSEFLHIENFILVDQQGHIRGLYNGTLAVEVGRIIEDVDELLNYK